MHSSSKVRTSWLVQGVLHSEDQNVHGAAASPSLLASLTRPCFWLLARYPSPLETASLLLLYKGLFRGLFSLFRRKKNKKKNKEPHDASLI